MDSIYDMSYFQRQSYLVLALKVIIKGDMTCCKREKQNRKGVMSVIHQVMLFHFHKTIFQKALV